eukprot:EG_transcript_49376
MAAFGVFGAALVLLLASPSTAQSTTCVDQTGWKDSNKYTCSDYQRFGWCKGGWYGPKWNVTWGMFSRYCVPSSTGCVGADVACCACGRNAGLDAVGCVVGAWGDWSNCTLVGDPED